MVTRTGDREIGVISGKFLVIRESWHVCNFSSFYAMSAKVTMSLWLVFPDEIS